MPEGAAAGFWHWFTCHERQYRLFQLPPHKFLEALVPQLKLFDPWLKALIGGRGDGFHELVITADGDMALFTKVHALVGCAPVLEGWKFTALKQPIGVDDVYIQICGKEFSAATLKFYPETDACCPDEVSIVLTHVAYDCGEDEDFQSGGLIYLESALGELKAATEIDRYRVGPEPANEAELISMGKLPGYLQWRKKEFIEKYDLPPPELPAEKWIVFEAELASGKPLLAAFNKGYAHWPFRPYYPWLAVIDIRYQGEEDGLPCRRQWLDLQRIEDDLMALLPWDQVLLWGHKTHEHARILYIYVRDFLRVSSLIYGYLESANPAYELTFFMTRDKYWKAAANFFE